MINRNDIKDQLDLLEWKLSNNAIEKTYIFKDFKSALEFVNQVGQLAEESDHHPNILMHDWNKVTVTATTHSEGGVTDKDIDLAKRINEKT
ncbi:MAG: 4a-hydroxytetrahydrobiopterin dehydratase [candidate division KSB1 bacterium]|nr:4a-hydroxytetrahydrobiopterin dehydratase [candidate division KSB1 bacterium]